MAKTLKQARKELIDKCDEIINKIEDNKPKLLKDKLDIVIEKLDKSKGK